eukprot:COSAG02_NODE_5743_length_4073_cov_47.272771_3_plen_219_part_00
MGCAVSRESPPPAGVKTGAAAGLKSNGEGPVATSQPAPHPSDPIESHGDLAAPVQDTLPPQQPPEEPRLDLEPEPKSHPEQLHDDGRAARSSSPPSVSFTIATEDADLVVALEEQSSHDTDLDGAVTPADSRQRKTSASSRSSRSSVERETFDELPDVPDNLLEMTDAELADVQDLEESDEDDDQHVTMSAPFAYESAPEPGTEPAAAAQAAQNSGAE